MCMAGWLQGQLRPGCLRMQAVMQYTSDGTLGRGTIADQATLSQTAYIDMTHGKTPSIFSREHNG
jgi:hypothetical protein